MATSMGPGKGRRRKRNAAPAAASISYKCSSKKPCKRKSKPGKSVTKEGLASKIKRKISTMKDAGSTRKIELSTKKNSRGGTDSSLDKKKKPKVKATTRTVKAKFQSGSEYSGGSFSGTNFSAGDKRKLRKLKKKQ